jgi:uncharacterized SAM-binding protein YcdF (DUF218 family)
MFFISSKIIWPLISPANFIFILIILGSAYWFISKKIAKYFFVIAGTLYLLIGFFPVGHNLLVYLESSYQQQNTIPPDIEGIIILGGYFSAEVSESHNVPALNTNGDRVVEAIRLHKIYPKAKLVFSGGHGKITRSDVVEPDITKTFLKSFDLDPSDFIFEETSRNTFENIKNSYKKIQPDNNDKWLIVSSAYHMSRVMDVAKSLDWDLMAHPVDYRTNGKYSFLPTSFDVSGHFMDFEIAIRELIGHLAYRLSGKITI